MAAQDHLGSQFTLYHGSRHPFSPGDHVEPGHGGNYDLFDTSGLAFASKSAASAAKYAKMAQGDGPARVFQVEPTGPVHPDTAGNKHAVYSEHPMRVTREMTRFGGVWR